MKILATAALVLGLVNLPSLAGSSWGDGSGDLVPGDGGKPLIVDPWVGELPDDVIKLDDPWIIIDIGPSEEDEGIIFDDGQSWRYNGTDRSRALIQR
jgi:hypothetical protein